MDSGRSKLLLKAFVDLRPRYLVSACARLVRLMLVHILEGSLLFDDWLYKQLGWGCHTVT